MGLFSICLLYQAMGLKYLLPVPLGRRVGAASRSLLRRTTTTIAYLCWLASYAACRGWRGGAHCLHVTEYAAVEFGRIQFLQIGVKRSRELAKEVISFTDTVLYSDQPTTLNLQQKCRLSTITTPA